MTSPEIERAFESHEAFVVADDGYDLTTTVFETTITAEQPPDQDRRDGRIAITVFLPTLSAATVDDVADVVEDGWVETLERRLEDVFTVAGTDTHEEPRVERDEDVVRVHLEYVAWDADDGVTDAKALVEFVEGTYAQGIIPGYEYRGEAAALLESARERGQGAGNEESGTPL